MLHSIEHFSSHSVDCEQGQSCQEFQDCALQEHLSTHSSERQQAAPQLLSMRYSHTEPNFHSNQKCCKTANIAKELTGP